MATEYKFDDDLPITDISGLGSFDFGPMSKPEAVVIHHTGGRGTAEDVMNVFNQRNFPAQFIMDRDGNVFRALPEGMKGQHIRPSQINNLSNSNTLGIEIIAKDDNDLTPAQREASTRWLNFVGNKYGIPAANVFGHGELNSHKQATEGSTVVNDWRGSNRVAQPDLGPPAAGGDLPMGQRTLMAYAGRDVPQRPASPFEAEYAAASKETGIPVEVLRAKDAQESRFNPNLIGRSGEIGIGQVKPSTAADPGFGVEPMDPARLKNPADNIMFGARYLAARAKAAGVTDWSNPDSIAKGLTAYNGGGDPNYAANVMRYINNPGSLPVPDGSVPRLNPSLTAAAERGRGPAADRPARDSAYVEANVPAMAPQPQIDPMRNETGLQGRQIQVAAEEQRQGQTSGMPAGDASGFSIPPAQSGGGQRVGGLGGLGGFALPGGGAGDMLGPMLQAFGMSLLSGDRNHPLKNFPTIFHTLQTAANSQAKTAQEQGALASALKMSGMNDQQARLFAVNPTAAKLALEGIQRQAALGQEDAYGRRIAGIGGPQPTSAPAPDRGAGSAPAPGGFAANVPAATSPAPSAPLPSQGAASPAPAQGGRPAPLKIDSGNRTVDWLFGQRAQHVQEYDALARELAAAPTDRAKNMVENRMKAIEKRIAGIDKQVDQYGNTGDMREYFFDMAQRAKEGLPPVPRSKWDPVQERKNAYGPQAEEVAGLRKEVQNLPSYKNLSQAAPIYRGMFEAAGRDTKAADLNLVYGLGKIFDPNSVVREGEMVMVKNTSALPDWFMGVVNQLNGKAGLTPETREKLMQEAYGRLQSYRDQFAQDTGMYRGIVQRRGVNEADVVPDFGEFKPWQREKPKGGAGGSGAQPAPPPSASGGLDINAINAELARRQQQQSKGRQPPSSPARSEPRYDPMGNFVGPN